MSIQHVRLDALAPIVVVVLTALLGCGGSEFGAEVSGTVTLDGKPVGPGTIAFVSAQKTGSNPPMGAIQVDGSYTLHTAQKPGLAPGTYRATVLVMDGEVPKPGERSMKPMTYVTPEKYSNVDTSGLQFEVKPGRQTIDIPLTTGDD